VVHVGTRNIILILAIITVASLKLNIYCSVACATGLNNNEYQITRDKMRFMFPLLNFFVSFSFPCETSVNLELYIY
jgi:membrane protein insertase Oxa1/YidC/SpoIIIJ